MKRVFIVVLLGIMLAIPAVAQTGQQTSPKDPMATWLHNAFNTNRKNIEKSAEKVSEDFYGLRPGPQEEVRTFGQILGHLANFNYMWCSQAQVPRMSLLVLNYGHNNDHYGNLVTYMRIRSIVPASSEPRPQQPQAQR